MSILIQDVRPLDRGKTDSSKVEDFGDRGKTNMRFMMMVKSRENSGPPPKELMEAISKLSEEGKNRGSLVASGGLAPTTGSTRVRVCQGKLTVMDGPFTETKEVVGGYAVMEFKSKQEALDSAVQFMELHQEHWPGWEGETEVRQIFGPEDYRLETSHLTPELESHRSGQADS